MRASGRTREGTALTDDERTQLDAELSLVQGQVDALRDLELATPTHHAEEQTRVELGSMTLELYPMQAHTDADLVIYIAQAKVLITGDVLDEIPYGGHGRPRQWLAALEQLAKLEVETIIPGHGALMGPEAIDRAIELWSAILEQAKLAVERDESPADRYAAWEASAEHRRLRSAMVHDAVGERAFDKFKPPPKPYCPPGYDFHFGWQSCWPDGDPPRNPPSGRLHEHACYCPPGYSYLTDTNYCWERGTSLALDHDEFPHPGGFAGSGDCPFGEVWDFTTQGCIERPPCPDIHDIWVEHLGRCVSNDCDERNSTVTFKHWLGDCVGNDDWEPEIIAALEGAARRLWPAWLMLDYMRESSPEYAEYLWNFGLRPLWYDEQDLRLREEDPSMKRWFGPYSEYRLDLIYAVLGAVLVRMTQLPVLIRCHNVGDACAGKAGYAIAGTGPNNPGTIHLCNKWMDEPNQQVWRITHEYMHYTLIGWILNFPRDIHHPNCVAGDTDTCYRQRDSGFLGDNLGITEWFHDNGAGWSEIGKDWGSQWRKLPAAMCNIDNYNSWLSGRFKAWGDCEFPIGAVRL